MAAGNLYELVQMVQTNGYEWSEKIRIISGFFRMLWYNVIMNEKMKNFFNSAISLVSKIIILAVVVYIFFNIGRSIWKNWQVSQKIKNYEGSIQTLEEQNNYLKNQLIYMQTDVFKELEARSRLGLKKPDEKMIIVPENTDVKTTTTQKSNSDSSQVPAENLPNPTKWWKYVLGK